LGLSASDQALPDGLAESMSQYLIRRIEEAPNISLHTRTPLAALDGASVSPGRAAMRNPK
jgi:hypothetical protein